MARKKVIVIGSGIIGASIAWHLARDGADVTIIANKRAGVATPNSFAWINANWGNPRPYFELRRKAMAGWKQLADAIDGVLPQWCGSICYDLPIDGLKAFEAEHSAWGYGIQAIDRSTVAAMESNIRDVPEYALFIPEEGMIEPVTATQAMLSAAEKAGAQLRMATIDRLLVEGDRVAGVIVSGEPILADEIVLAAGAASRDLGLSAGFDIPVEASPGLLMHTKPHPPLIKRIIVAPHLEIRQTAEGRIIAATSYAGSEPGDDPMQTANNVLSAVKATLLKADTLELEHLTIGYRPMPKDGFPIISRVDGKQGLYVAVTHSGITLAPAIGQMAAKEILTGNRDPLIAPYDHARFAKSTSGAETSNTKENPPARRGGLDSQDVTVDQ